jgi:hypothetical protein
MNFIHAELFSKEAIEVSSIKLLKLMGAGQHPEDSRELLLYFRTLERNKK